MEIYQTLSNGVRAGRIEIWHLPVTDLSRFQVVERQSVTDPATLTVNDNREQAAAQRLGGLRSFGLPNRRSALSFEQRHCLASGILRWPRQ